MRSLIILMLSTVLLAEGTVNATVDRKHINEGDSIILSVVAENVGGSPNLVLPKMIDFKSDDFKNDNFRFGLCISNIGPDVDFIDEQQADPLPTNMKIGFYSHNYNTLGKYWEKLKEGYDCVFGSRLPLGPLSHGPTRASFCFHHPVR